MIIYFSGTGNSLSIARVLASQLDEKAISIHDAIKQSCVEDECIGLVFPVHNYDIPRFVKEGLEQLHFTSAKYTFAIITHGGNKGNALHSTQKLLQGKALQLNYYNDVLMPVNSRIMYGRITDKIEERAKSASWKAETIAADINNRVQITKQIPHKRFLNFMHNIVEKDSIRTHFTPKVKPQLCINCGICAKVCPSNNITFESGKAIINNNCHQCTNCLHWCPQLAIHYKRKDIRKEQQYHHPSIKVNDITLK